uniref:Uncharacterized protein n=1 Tax=Rhizophora mucronata TaxID=61149 RepID=A0A2P2NPN7_RHIMU
MCGQGSNNFAQSARTSGNLNFQFHETTAEEGGERRGF